MTDKELLEMYQEKKEFAQTRGEHLSKYPIFGIDSVDYDVLTQDGLLVAEFVIVNHRGGAQSIIDTTGSSLIVIGEEIESVTSEGRYDQNERYKKLKQESKSLFDQPAQKRR